MLATRLNNHSSTCTNWKCVLNYYLISLSLYERICSAATCSCSFLVYAYCIICFNHLFVSFFQTALHYAAEENDTVITNLLLTHGANAKFGDIEGTHDV